MNKQLHLLKEKNDLKAISVIESLALENPGKIEVVLLQEARETVRPWISKTYLLDEHENPGQVDASGIKMIGYDDLVDLIFEADTVVAW